MNSKDFVKTMNKHSEVIPGSRWVDTELRPYYVITVYQDDGGNVWVYYRDGKDNEYSCWIESFLSRFSLCMSNSSRC